MQSCMMSTVIVIKKKKNPFQCDIKWTGFFFKLKHSVYELMFYNTIRYA